MTTPAEMPVRISPIGGERILHLAEEIRSRFEPREIDAAANSSDILLIRIAGGTSAAAGFAHIGFVHSPEFIESLANPGERIRVWERNDEKLRSIVINTDSAVPEAEIFWHEWYHLFYSPESIQRSESFDHRFMLESAIDSREERRADEFAAAVLVPSIEGCQTVSEIVERFGVSERLAKVATRLYHP